MEGWTLHVNDQTELPKEHQVHDSRGLNDWASLHLEIASRG